MKELTRFEIAACKRVAANTKSLKTKLAKLTSKIEQKLIENNIVLENARERIHLIIGIVENLCHEIVYHKHDEINYDIMKKEVINMIKKSLN